MKPLSNAYLASFCLELGYILRSGMPLANGLALLRDDDDDAASRGLLDKISGLVDRGLPLGDALAQAGGFPEHLLRMVGLAEKTGRMEPALMALARHYEQQRLLRLGVRRALLYPALLLGVFLVVAAVLVTQVLPVFEGVFRQLGATLSPTAQALMSFGRRLTDASAVIAAVSGGLAAAAALLAVIRPARRGIGRFLRRRFGGFGLWGELLRARFASALGVAIASGLDADESIDAAAALVRGARGLDAKIDRCRELLGAGRPLPEALSESGVFSARSSRFIAMGFETGAIDEVMREIAERGERDVDERLGALVGAIEPTIVILASLMAGAILLSVMLPLVSIMSGIA